MQAPGAGCQLGRACAQQRRTPPQAHSSRRGSSPGRGSCPPRAAARPAAPTGRSQTSSWQGGGGGPGGWRIQVRAGCRQAAAAVARVAFGANGSQPASQRSTLRSALSVHRTLRSALHCRAAHTSLAVEARPPRRISGASHNGLVAPPAVDTSGPPLDPAAAASCAASLMMRDRLKSATCGGRRMRCGSVCSVTHPPPRGPATQQSMVVRARTAKATRPALACPAPPACPHPRPHPPCSGCRRPPAGWGS